MTRSTVVFTALKSSEEAGRDLAKQALAALDGQVPSVFILFASSSYDCKALLQAIDSTCTPEILIGCSSAGEFTSANFETDSASAVAIYSSDMAFSAGLGTGIKSSRSQVAAQLLSPLKGLNKFDYPFQTGLILADALSGHTDEIIDLLTERTGTYQFFGGGAGDNANFQQTHVFLGTEAHSDAAVILEILSKKPLGIGVRHGWQPVGEKMRVTDSEGMEIISLNGAPAAEVFKEYAEATEQALDLNDPVPFFLHNILGVQTEQGFKLRVPLAALENGTIVCASDVPKGATISFMAIEPQAANNAAEQATNMAIENLKGHKPSVALFFDCVATRLRMGSKFENELELVNKTLGNTQYAGCNTYGQIARVNGQFSGFHNCTAVVCVIPE